METITIEELIREMNSGDSHPKLINALEPTRFEKMHIPNSLNFADWDNIEKRLYKDDDIIVYCTNKVCYRSHVLYHRLKDMGYRNLKRYPGGLEEWDRMGLQLESGLTEDMMHAA